MFFSSDAAERCTYYELILDYILITNNFMIEKAW